jgi:hypothetical protein
LRPIQYFSAEYLKHCKDFSTEQILDFVDDFRILFAEKINQNKLIEQEKSFLKIKDFLK